MAVRSVLLRGDPLLRRIADPVTQVGTPQIESLVADMAETLRAIAAAGLAAPQIGVSLRIVVFELRANSRYPDAEPVPFTVLINPVLTPLAGDRVEAWEECQSVPGLRGRVSRFGRLRYEGFDPSGGRVDRVVDGLHARIVQHEVDHLDGILFPERVRDPAGLRKEQA